MAESGTIIQDLNRLLGLKQEQPEFNPHTQKNSILSRRGIAGEPSAQTAGTAGIASPLTEGIDAITGEPAREYYDDKIITSPDGLLTISIKPIKTLNFTDAKSNEVVIKLAEPKNTETTP